MNAQKPAKKHHFIPQMYLTQFMDKDSNTVWVIDTKRVKQFGTKPQRIAFENNLYTIENLTADAEVKKDHLEQSIFSKLEGATKPLILDIDNNEKLPSQDSQEYYTLMEFLCLLFLRTPRFKELQNDAFDDLMKQFTALDASNMKQFNSYRQQQEKLLNDFDPNLNFEDYLEFLENKQFRFEYTQNYFLKSILNMWNEYVPYFAQRTWDIYISKEPNNANFISCDHPVFLDWSKPSQKASLYGPGLALKNTEITIPLTDKVALVGSFENKGQVIPASRAHTAVINSRTLTSADRFIFASNQNVYWLCNQLIIQNTAHLLSTLSKPSQHKTADNEGTNT